jgi:4-coumarate--CoA ligase
MPIQSPYAPLGIPEKNILHYLFLQERQEPTTDKPIWIEASNTSVYLTRQTLLQWATRLAIGFDKLRDAEKRLIVQPGDAVMIFSSNQVMIPVAYLGTVGSGRIFSGVNAAFTVRGTYAD